MQNLAAPVVADRHKHVPEGVSKEMPRDVCSFLCFAHIRVCLRLAASRPPCVSVCVCACVHLCVCTSVRAVRVCALSRVCASACVHECVRACVHAQACMCACMHAHMHTRARARTHAVPACSSAKEAHRRVHTRARAHARAHTLVEDMLTPEHTLSSAPLPFLCCALSDARPHRCTSHSPRRRKIFGSGLLYASTASCQQCFMPAMLGASTNSCQHCIMQALLGPSTASCKRCFGASTASCQHCLVSALLRCQALLYANAAFCAQHCPLCQALFCHVRSSYVFLFMCVCACVCVSVCIWVRACAWMDEWSGCW